MDFAREVQRLALVVVAFAAVVVGAVGGWRAAPIEGWDLFLLGLVLTALVHSLYRERR